MEQKFSYTGNVELFGVDPKELLADGYIHIVKDGWEQWLSPDEYEVIKKINYGTDKSN